MATIQIKMEVKVTYSDKYSVKYTLNGTSVTIIKTENLVKVFKGGCGTTEFKNSHITTIAGYFAESGVTGVRNVNTHNPEIHQFLTLTNCI